MGVSRVGVLLVESVRGTGPHQAIMTVTELELEMSVPFT
jgi:hypothetical protein